MFGDIGHGSILLFIGAFMTIFADYLKALDNPAIKSLLQARYLLLLLGFFATYMGFIYNDFMSLPTRLFSSCYDIEGYHKADELSKGTQKVYKNLD